MHLNSPDNLSFFLKKLSLDAEIYVDGNFCGAWSVDTSGEKRIPFHLVGEGEAWLHFENRAPKKIMAGDLVVFPHDSPHVVSYSDTLPTEINGAIEEDHGGPTTNLICGFFDFKDTLSLPVLDALSPVIVMCTETTHYSSTSKQLIQLIIHELSNENAGYYAAKDALAYLLFIEVIRNEIHTGRLETGILAALFDRQIGKALNCIHTHPMHKWTVEGLANEAAMGRTTFSQRFSELVGMSVMQYLGHWRMKEATHLLSTTAMSVIQIAELCGYESEASFSKAYKKITSNTPGAIRRQNQH